MWEIPQKNLIIMAADRGAFIDQSQSLNIHLAEPTFGKMSSMHFYAWKIGLKTGLYYLRTRPAADPIKFTVDKTKLKSAKLNDVTNSGTSPKITNGLSGIENKQPLTNGVNGTQITVKTVAKEETKSIDKELESNTDLIESLKLACSLQNKEACMMCSSWSGMFLII